MYICMYAREWESIVREWLRGRVHHCSHRNSLSPVYTCAAGIKEERGMSDRVFSFAMQVYQRKSFILFPSRLKGI